MAWEDRDYSREPEETGFRHRLSGHSVVTWLLAINFIVFVLDAILTGSTRGTALSPSYWGNFNFEQGVAGFQLWRWFTYQFIHAGFFHVTFNMLGLYFFGPMMERWWGSKRFLAFYLMCGASGAVLYSLLGLVPDLLPGGNLGTLVGASGSLYGILAACAVLFPQHRVMLLFPPIPMSMRTLALVFLGLAALSLIAGSPNAGGEAAHLGGAALGFLLVKFPASLTWADRIRRPQRPAADSWSGKLHKQRDAEAKEDAQVDRILDKVREHGLQSLTKSEKGILLRATERHRRSG